MNSKNYINIFKTDPAITSSNGEIQKAIDFKIKKMMNLNINIISKTENISNVEKKVSNIRDNDIFEEALIRNVLKTPISNVGFKHVLDNYYYGLFYDGIVYFLKFEKGFYIARKNEVEIKNNVLFFNGKKPLFYKEIGNIDYSINEFRPQYKEIELTLQKKFYTEVLTVEALDRGTIVQNVLINKNDMLQDTEVSNLRQRLASIFGIKKKIRTQNFGEYKWDENDSSTLILSGDWEYKSEKVSLNDISNEDTISKARDYIYNFLGVPPQLMGSSESSTYSNYQEAMSNFLNNTVIPDLNNFIDLINNNFLDDSNFYLEIDTKNIPEFIEYKKSNFNMLSQLFSEGVITEEQYLEESGFGDLGEGGKEVR